MSADLYDTDFYTWATTQAALLRSGRLAAVDIGNIAEELETLGRSEAAALRSAYRLICLHLLKMLAQPERGVAGSSWERTVHTQRINAEQILKDNPGLKPKRESLFGEAYAAARKEASFETGLPLTELPEEPPFTLDQVEGETFWPPGFPAARAPDRPPARRPRRPGRTR